jgi:RimJ/RimL family protein N-acetyltransferase
MTFAPIETERLLLRPPRLADAAALAERRSDPGVAEYQNWVPPFPLERAQEMLAELSAMEGPVSDSWWMLTITDADDSTIFGDLALHPTFDGRSIEIGYTLRSAVWGQGYAYEAVDALIDRLWSDDRVTRISAMLHPDNHGSERVLERTGFRFEGHTRLSYWVDERNSDDLIYGMTRDDRTDWLERPLNAPIDVRLVGVDASNVHTLRKLEAHRSQQRFVSSMATSLADALRPQVDNGGLTVAMPFGVEADGEIVGFVMMTAITEHHPDPKLWRLLIDRRHQRRGIGRRVLDAVVDECRQMSATSLITHWCEGRGSPRPFYEQHGFVTNGEFVHGETEAVLHLRASLP